MKLSMLFLCIWLCVTPCQSADQILPKHVVAPIYPLLCWQARLQGTVRVDVELGRDGKVVSAKGSGAHPLLNRAAEDNVRLWTFSSPLQESSAKFTITYVWRLEGKEQERYDSSAVVTMDFPDRVEVVAHPPRPGT